MNHQVNYPSHAGHSMVELCVALVLVVILAALGYPVYHNAALHSRRAEAKAALHTLLIQQEQYYTQHNTYIAFDSTSSNPPFKWWSGDTASASYYELEAQTCPNKTLSQCVLLRAIPGTENVKSHTDPICGTLLLDSANNKGYSNGDMPNSACW